MAKRIRILKRVDEKILVFCAKHGLIQRGDSLLVAFSGGADSVFLLSFLLRHQRAHRLRIAAAHVNHQLRGAESDADEAFCRTFCRQAGVPLHVQRTDVARLAKKNKMSIEEAGRKTRYDFFQTLRSSHGYQKIVTAHHLNDNTESVLLNLCRGTGLSGLGGILPSLAGKIIRPMLMVNKEEILTALAETKSAFRVDASNDDDKFRRNFMRNKVLPLLRQQLNPSLDEAVMKLSNTARGATEFIEQYLALKFELLLMIPAATSISLPVKLLKEESSFIVAELFRLLTGRWYGRPAESSEIEMLLNLITAAPGKTGILRGGIVVKRDREAINFQKTTSKPSEQSEQALSRQVSVRRVKRYEKKYGARGDVEFIDADKITGELKVGQWKTGERFYPIGGKGAKRVSDFLTDAKVPPSEKRGQLVLRDGSSIVWVVGLRLDDRYKVTGGTRNFIKLTMTKKK